MQSVFVKVNQFNLKSYCYLYVFEIQVYMFSNLDSLSHNTFLYVTFNFGDYVYCVMLDIKLIFELILLRKTSNEQRQIFSHSRSVFSYIREICTKLNSVKSIVNSPFKKSVAIHQQLAYSLHYIVFQTINYQCNIQFAILTLVVRNIKAWQRF